MTEVADTRRRGLGVGMDLQWGAPVGFEYATAAPSTKVAKFIERHVSDYAYLFFSFQPRGLERLEARAYADSYERLRELLPAAMPMALHHTVLNMGSARSYDRSAIFDFTNELCEIFDLQWIVEDIGIWSLGGLPMPYPLPPYLTPDALDQVVRNAREVRGALSRPLHVEFPGFTDSYCLVIGSLDAYDYFAELADRADIYVTLDVGHLLSWRWLRGFRGADLFGDLDRLPLERCRELHLSGAAVHRGRFIDLHHGILLEEQLELCRILLQRCPGLTAVTYEDPRFTSDGSLVPKAVPNYERLRKMVRAWATSQN
jgi:uncharacterized protein (UPF0276 family)